MLKDHVDFDRLMNELRDYTAGKGPKPADIARWRKAVPGEVCGGCGRPFVPGQPIQEALHDGSIGHAHCHAGSAPIRVEGGRPPRRGSGS